MEKTINTFKHIKTIINDYLYNLWYSENAKDLEIKFAESGADRELDFDEEEEILKEWKKFKDEMEILV